MSSPPTVAAIVPMRHVSVRVPGKNYRPLGGRPLYHHVVQSLLASPRVGQVVIDTDSDLLRDDVARHFPEVRLIERPPHLRADTIPMNDVLLNTVRHVEADFYLQTHSTNPFLREATITGALDALMDMFPERDSLFSVTRLQTRLWDQHGRPMNHDPAVLLRTQDLPPVYEENSNIFVFTREILERRGNRIGERPLLFEVDRLEALDIDEEHDFRIAEMLLQTLFQPS
jgi:CMP-N-acetylneuraminic acid synthetase